MGGVTPGAGGRLPGHCNKKSLAMVGLKTFMPGMATYSSVDSDIDLGCTVPVGRDRQLAVDLDSGH